MSNDAKKLEDAAERLWDAFPVAVVGDVFLERARQDAQWGGPAHDDTHTMGDWLNLIYKQVGMTQTSTERDEAELRGRMVKIAALALAALASYERKTPKAVCQCPACALEEMMRLVGVDARVHVLSPTRGLDMLEALMVASFGRASGKGGKVH